MERSRLALLERFFTAKTSPPGQAAPKLGDRYVPLGYSSEGTGWGVFDCVEQRFLEDDEVEALAPHELMHAKLSS